MQPVVDFRTATGPFGALTDEQVVARVLAGESALFEVLMRRHNQRLYRVARVIVRDDAEAEDVMQEAYVRAFAQLAQFEGRASWGTWVTRIAVNEALARVRRRGRFVDADIDGREESNGMPFQNRSPDDPHSTDPPGPEDHASARQLVNFLEGAVDALPDIYRTVFVLREVEGLSTADTAGALDISEELVKVRLHRARAELRRILESRVGTAMHDLYGFHLSRCDVIVNCVLARIGVRLIRRARARARDTSTTGDQLVEQRAPEALGRAGPVRRADDLDGLGAELRLERADGGLVLLGVRVEQLGRGLELALLEDHDVAGEQH